MPSSSTAPRTPPNVASGDALPYTRVLVQYSVTVCVCPRRVSKAKSVQTLQSPRSLPAQGGRAPLLPAGAVGTLRQNNATLMPVRIPTIRSWSASPQKAGGDFRSSADLRVVGVEILVPLHQKKSAGQRARLPLPQNAQICSWRASSHCVHTLSLCKCRLRRAHVCTRLTPPQDAGRVGHRAKPP